MFKHIKKMKNFKDLMNLGLNPNHSQDEKLYHWFCTNLTYTISIIARIIDCM
jgi:hypothetical protein